MGQLKASTMRAQLQSVTDTPSSAEAIPAGRANLADDYSDLSLVGQFLEAIKPENLPAVICGALFGSFVPVATCIMSNYEVADGRYKWIFVGGGLVFSALTVYDFATLAFGNKLKALGFTVLLEGVMTFSSTGPLRIAALCYLIAINAVAAGNKLVRDHRLDARRRRS